jgi:hypothetical protein
MSETSSLAMTATAALLTNLEPYSQKRIVSYLNLADRSRLRQCRTALYRSVEAFDLDLLVASTTPKNGVGGWWWWF